ncbi:MAG: TonB-dependent receptor [Deltaproteobacteria bacterium]|nr:TonB-dependent receptor [Deltaproteobacteria bacterium]
MTAVLLCALLFGDDPASAPASEESFDVFNIFEEQQTVSTGAVRETRLREAPTSVWVVDRATLERQPMLTLYDALRLVPGINIIEYNMGQGEANLRFIGSFPEHQSLTLVDGRAVASDAIGYFDYTQVDRRNVEKIEVVLGPSSTLYGANAFSGVVNIVTKKPTRKGHELGFAFDGGFASGNTGVARNQPLRFGLMTQGHASYGYGWQSGGFRLSASGTFMETGGAQGNYMPLVVATPVRQSAFTFDLAQDIGKVQTRLQLGAAMKKSPYMFFEVSDAGQQDYYANLIIERDAIAGKDDRLSANVWVKHNRIDFEGTYAGTETIPFVMDTTSVEGRIAYTLPTFYWNSLTVGAQARGIFVTTNSAVQLAEAGQRQLLAGLFVEDMFRPLPAWQFNAGLRVDTREMAATKAFRYLSFSPRASIVWLVNDGHSLRLEYASAFRTPTAVERGLYVAASDGTPIVVGNLNLRNERVHSFTLSYMGRVKWFSMRIEAWLERTLDNIIPVLAAAGDVTEEIAGQQLFVVPDTRLKVPFYFYNAVGFWIPGASLKLAIEPINNLRVALTYMFMPSPLTNRIGLTADYQPIPRLNVALQVFYYGNVYSQPVQYPTRIILNAKVAYQLDDAGAWHLSANVLNALDLRIPHALRPNATHVYRESIAGGRVGPRAWIGLDATFD